MMLDSSDANVKLLHSEARAEAAAKLVNLDYLFRGKADYLKNGHLIDLKTRRQRRDGESC